MPIVIGVSPDFMRFGPLGPLNCISYEPTFVDNGRIFNESTKFNPIYGNSSLLFVRQ
jgi:hypothetical protein